MKWFAIIPSSVVTAIVSFYGTLAVLNFVSSATVTLNF